MQRTLIKGQSEMDLGLGIDNVNDISQDLAIGECVYRAIATNLENLTASDIIHFYNQRGEDSENRIKELKNDFGAKQVPCSDFNANALYSFDRCL